MILMVGLVLILMVFELMSLILCQLVVLLVHLLVFLLNFLLTFLFEFQAWLPINFPFQLFARFHRFLRYVAGFGIDFGTFSFPPVSEI